MREPKHYEDHRGRHWVTWYDRGRRIKKCFNDPLRAELLYQEKLIGHPIDRDALILKEVATIKKYVAGGRIIELEAENARLREENARVIIPSALAAESGGEPPQFESKVLRSDVRLLRAGVAKKLGVPAALILQQLNWLLENRPEHGRVLSDGERYIFNTYPDWRNHYFPFYSVPTLERQFKFLEDLKLVISAQPDGRASRRKYYRLTPEGIKMMDSGQTEGSKRGIGSHQFAPSKASKSELPSSNTNRESTSKTSTRPQASEGIRSGLEREKELLDRIEALCGPAEMNDHGGMWRTFARHDARALRNAIESCELRSDNYHLPRMKNPGAMLNEAYQRCLDELRRSEGTPCSPDKSLRELVRESIRKGEPL